jgi:AcrR family transcriptional regulator
MNDKRDLLLQTAMALFIAEGLSVPTAAIAKKAGVANGTLFNYFPTKQDLIDTLYLATKKEVAAALQPVFLDSSADFALVLLGVWDGYVRWAVGNPLKHRALRLLKTANGLSKDAAARANDDFRPLETLARTAMRRGEILTTDLDYFQLVMAAQIDAAIDFALARGVKGKALGKLIAASFEIFRKGVAP